MPGWKAPGSYGAALTRYLRRHDITIVEVNRPDRTAAVGTANSQAIDQLKAVLVGADPALRDTLSGLSRTALIRHCVTTSTAAPPKASPHARPSAA